MRFTLTIDCDNAAFADDPGREVATMLKTAAVRIGSGTDEFAPGADFTVRDGNGNTVGRWQVTAG